MGRAMACKFCGDYVGKPHKYKPGHQTLHLELVNLYTMYQDYPWTEQLPVFDIEKICLKCLKGKLDETV